MSSKQKIKGAGYERTVAKRLSALYNDSFVRSAQSGAFIGGVNSFRKSTLNKNQVKAFKGDINPPDHWKNFNSECKNYKGFSFHLLLSGTYSQIDAWISQMLEVAEPTDVSVLFMKFDRIGEYVLISDSIPWAGEDYFRYNSPKFGKWKLMRLDYFLDHNAELLKTLSCQ